MDAIGGLTTIVLGVLGLAGVAPTMMVGIATVVFGAALLIQGGTMLSEYARIIFPPGAKASSIDHFGGNSLSVVFLVGAGGIVLGLLALLGIHAMELAPITSHREQCSDVSHAAVGANFICAICARTALTEAPSFAAFMAGSLPSDLAAASRTE